MARFLANGRTRGGFRRLGEERRGSIARFGRRVIHVTVEMRPRPSDCVEARCKVIPAGKRESCMTLYEGCAGPCVKLFDRRGIPITVFVIFCLGGPGSGGLRCPANHPSCSGLAGPLLSTLGPLRLDEGCTTTLSPGRERRRGGAKIVCSSSRVASSCADGECAAGAPEAVVCL